MKVFVVNKRSICTYICIFAAVIAIIGFNWEDTVSVFEQTSKKDLPIYSVGRDDKYCSVSFDAAWGNEDTETLIKILNDYNVKATFFVVGSWVDKYPESVKQLSDAGHEVMNHSNTHPHMTQIGKEKMLEEVTLCDNKIEKITGKKPTLFRPPYGDYNNEVVGTMRDSGHYTIQWDVDSLDWKDLSAQAIYERVTSQVTSGSIILFHNAAKHTPEALPMILKYLKDNNYNVVPISKLIYKKDFTVDHTGKQISNAAINSVE